jgi:hypothetical protein
MAKLKLKTIDDAVAFFESMSEAERKPLQWQYALLLTIRDSHAAFEKRLDAIEKKLIQKGRKQ